MNRQGLKTLDAQRETPPAAGKISRRLDMHKL